MKQTKIIKEIQDINFTNLDKVYSDKSKVTKEDILKYYIEMSELIIPHIYNKPFSMIHFPKGINHSSFYQKECPSDAPKFIKTISLESSTKGTINWCLVNDLPSILYMANRNVIEMHSWFSRLPNLRKSDVAIIDLDPNGTSGFKEAIIIARAFGVLLKELKIFAIPMTSGSSGIHIRIPIINKDFKEIQSFLNKLCDIVISKYSDIATTERIISKRGNKIYLDAIQNAYGKTIIAPYSLRAKEHFPVATPLLWQELENEKMKPRDFNINNIFSRLEKVGDLFENFHKKAIKLPKL